MFINCRKRRACWWVLYSLVLLVFYNEWLCYHVTSWYWPGENSVEACSSPSYRILLVADPQILGENTESAIARWDADRYLSKTFTLAVRSYKPSLIIFLGDLMDEGSSSTDSQFTRYFSRFYRIFSLDLYKNKTLYIPGDNDIGGEDDDVITKEKVHRFRNYFDQPDTFQTANIVIFKVNHMLRSYSTVNVSDKSVIRIAVSHYPMLDMPSRFMQRALVETSAQLILSAHDHKSMHFVGDRKTGDRLIIEELENNEYSSVQNTWMFQLNSLLSNEISVPTCSYRMGTDQMAYGVLNIDSKGETVCYSILWLPKRLIYLKLYLGYLSFILVIFIIYCLRNGCSRSYRMLPI